MTPPEAGAWGLFGTSDEEFAGELVKVRDLWSAWTTKDGADRARVALEEMLGPMYVWDITWVSFPLPPDVSFYDGAHTTRWVKIS